MLLKTRTSLIFLTICLQFVAVTAMGQNMPVPQPPIIGAKSFLLIDADTGAELGSLEADLRLAPASLTKLMTAYAVFRSLKDNQIGLADSVTVSEKAWRTPGSRMFIEVGTTVVVEDLILCQCRTR